MRLVSLVCSLCVLVVVSGSAVQDKAPPAELKTGTAGVIVAVGPGGKVVATADPEDRNGRVRRWDVATGKAVELEGHLGKVRHLAFTPDGRRLFAFNDGLHERRRDSAGYTVWEAATGKVLDRPEGIDEDVMSVAFSPDGKRLALGTRRLDDRKVYHSQVRVWDLDTGKAVARCGNTSCPANIPGIVAFYGTSLAWSPDGKTLAIGGHEGGGLTGTLTFWGGPDGRTFEHKLAGKHLAVQGFAPDGKTLLVGHQGTASVWSAEKGKVLELAGQGGGTGRFAFVSDGKAVVGVDSAGVALWDAATGKGLATRKGDFAQPQLTAAGSHLVTTDPAGTVRVWSTAALVEPPK